MAAITFLSRDWPPASLVPTLPMIYVVVATLASYIQQSNLTHASLICRISGTGLYTRSFGAPPTFEKIDLGIFGSCPT
jgi:hypothetical protein